MKHLFTLLASFIISSIFAQQKLIAVKGTVTDAIATTLDQAITLAQPGDIIYLPGGFYGYAAPIEKKVHIIGTGFQDGQNVMGRTAINGSLTLGGGANGSIFEGLYLIEWFTQTGSCTSDNITVKRCSMKGTYPVYNSSYINSHFINCAVRETLHLGEHWTTMGQNNFIQNCIITNWVYRTNASTIENCLLLGILECTNTFVKKNIFYRNDASCEVFSSSTGLVLENNLFKANCYSGYILNSTISTESGTTTYSELSDVFVNVPVTTFFNFNPTYDYHLKSPFTTTPANVGIYAGDFPWKDGSLPIIPNIEKNESYLDVQNGVFKLKVKVVPQTH
jgi:hypothetical protein